MIGNCRGCEVEWNVMVDYVKEGYHLVQQEITHIGERKHFFIMMVDEEGNVVIK